MIRIVSIGLGLIIVGLAGYLSFWPVPIDPLAFETPNNPGLVGPYAENERLTEAERIADGLLNGPEDTAMDSDGTIFTGLLDGRIVSFDPDDAVATFTEVANTGGRPLGLQFHPDGYLVIADAFEGLLALDTDSGEIRVLVDSYQGTRMIFVDDVDIGQDGTIWFSDASQRWDLHDNITDFFERRPTGRLFSYHPGLDELTLQLDDLYFANGVALGPGGAYVLVNETFAYRISRLWLTGPRAGEHDLFAEALPGAPDNLSFNGYDTFWVAFAVPRTDAADVANGSPFFRKMYFRLANLLNATPVVAHGFTVGFNLDGEVTHNFQSASGEVWMTTSINQHNDGLYVGNLLNDFVVRLPLDGAE